MVVLFINGDCSYLLAQKACTLSGVIKNNADQPIANATLIIHRKNDSLALYFSRSDNSGTYSITFPDSVLPALLSVSSLGYERKYSEIKPSQLSPNRNVSFVLNEEVRVLDEVIVRSVPKIQVSEDTTSYNLSEFTIGNERALEDALSRLPGFSINENGRISVNGRAIQKILIEGDDIVNQNYTLLSKNLNPSVISQVQVLDKYLDDPLLKGIEKTDDVALNLTFKNKNEKVFLGDASFEGGFDKKYRASLNEIALTKKFKAYALLSGNNIGVDPQLLSNTQSMSKTTLSKEYHPLQESKEFVSLSPGSVPLVDKSRSFFNNSQTASFNLLTKFSKKFDTKINLTISGDNNRLGVRQNTAYFSNSDTITYLEQSSWNSKPKKLESAINANYNFSPRSRLQYYFILNDYSIKEHATLTFNENLLKSHLSSAPVVAKHHVNYTFKATNRNALVMDFVTYKSRLPQVFKVAGYDYSSIFSQPANSLHQNSSNPITYIGGQVKFYSALNRASIIYNTGYDNYTHKIVSGISPGEMSPIINNNRSATNENLFFRVDFSNSYFKDKIEVIARAGVRAISLVNRSLAANEVVKKVSDVFFTPDATIRYQASRKSRFTIGYKYDRAYPDPTNLYDSLIFSNYRNATRYSDRVSLQNEQRASLGYRYSDSYSMVSAFISSFASITKNNYVDSSYIQPLLNVRLRYQMPTGYKTVGLFGGCEKFFPFLEGTVKLSANAINNRFENSVNEIGRQISSWNWGGKFSYVTAFDGAVNFVSTFQYLNNSNYVKSGEAVSRTNNKATHIVLKADYRLTKNYFLQIIGNRYQWLSVAGLQKPVYFFDASFFGNIIKDKLSVTATFQNMLNVRSLNFNQVSDYMVNNVTYELLPRFLIVGAKVRF